MKRILVVLALVWVVKWFNTAESLVAFLNKMEIHPASQARIIVAPSQRNVLGWADSPYGVIYWELK